MPDQFAQARVDGAVEKITARPAQLALPIELPVSASFDSFIDDGNATVVAALQGLTAMAAEGAEAAAVDQVLLFGADGAGKTHLLQAACRQVADRGGQVRYLPLAQMRRYDPRALEDLASGLGPADLFAIDDLQAVAGHSAWEASLFAIFNACLDAGVPRLFAADKRLDALGLMLRDLVSRLSIGVSLRVSLPTDQRREKIVAARASSLGMHMPAEVSRYLLGRFSRDIRDLMDAVSELDRASLQAKRKLTLPFVRETLKNGQ